MRGFQPQAAPYCSCQHFSRGDSDDHDDEEEGLNANTVNDEVS